MTIAKPLSFNRGSIAATESIISSLGEDCLYSPISGEPVRIMAVVTLSNLPVETDNGSFITYQGQMEANTTDMPNAVEDDLLAVNTNTEAAPVWVDYFLMEPEPDGLGRTFAWLKKV